MDGVVVVPVGTLPRELPERLAEFLEERTGRSCRVDALPIDPAGAYDRLRGQYDCRTLLPLLETRARVQGTLVLGAADVDLFSPLFTFVFGEARLGGRAGIFSLHRLRREQYGLPADGRLLLDRARREALHEMGHLLGLVHCRAPECAMSFSGSAEEVDLKGDRFCAACRGLANAVFLT